MYDDQKSFDLHTAISGGYSDTVRRLLADPEVDLELVLRKMTPFRLACHMGYAKIIQLFLDCKRPVNYNSSLHYNSSTAIYFALDNPAAFKMLVDDPRIDVNYTYPAASILLSAINHDNLLDNTKILLACERLEMETVTSRDYVGEAPLDYMRSPECIGYSIKAAEILEAYIEDPETVRFELRSELRYPECASAELFATIVLLCDDYYEIKVDRKRQKTK